MRKSFFYVVMVFQFFNETKESEGREESLYNSLSYQDNSSSYQVKANTWCMLKTEEEVYTKIEDEKKFFKDLHRSSKFEIHLFDEPMESPQKAKKYTLNSKKFSSKKSEELLRKSQELLRKSEELLEKDEVTMSFEEAERYLKELTENKIKFNFCLLDLQPDFFDSFTSKDE